MVMDIAASHIPEPEPYIEPIKPIEEAPPSKPLLPLNMVKFVAASKEASHTSSVAVALPELNAISLTTADSGSTEFEVLESGTIPVVTTPALKPAEEPRPNIAKPEPEDEAELLRKKREKEVMEQVMHALSSLWSLSVRSSW